ncbi:amino acid/polyamine/organocation transporter, APC superfamily [Conidiobolus coronatus NRRL 28638]|uniref:Amino acid/polyamine/organocation transporter, APC superfamily n=1 Tax=Conidiobolus coronatus (strain ATCC 28846 / CBS 209.66 / NRRL 28638) TaxID=796925 RepID=A0A137NX46_CONC2|nr:amino acid/polyamine/organocation transporter, APC superfamily [Conidiobolus coronatus NRRL 28638]|eukprot:KXN67251.1 amino acid/polyamine/organocation transporter, APC superfamily [Conidiobolus coronatus NRRL 28638]
MTSSASSSQTLFNKGQLKDETLFKFWLRCIFNKPSLSEVQKDLENDKLKRTLTLWNLITIGIGATIGTGIFIYPGIIAANFAGPAVVISYILAAAASLLTALCYAEISSLIPAAGSTYTYLYVTMGELVAWTISWALLLEFFIGASTLCIAWSAYFIQLLGIILKDPNYQPTWATAPIAWDITEQAFKLTGGYFNLPAIGITLVCTIILIIGTKESTTVTSVAVIIKLLAIIILVIGIIDHVDPDNWAPFILSGENDPKGIFGAVGILKGARIAFFSYTGFQIIGTTSQESINPQRDIPISTVATIGIATSLYIVVCLVIVGVVPFQQLNVPTPVSVAIRATGRTWLEVLVILGAVFGMVTSIIVTIICGTRFLYAISKDGLLPKFLSKLHPTKHTPHLNLIIVGGVLAIMSGLLPIEYLAEFTGIISFVAFFLTNISVSMLRYTHPDVKREFEVPFGGYVIPIIASMVSTVFIVTGSPQTMLNIFNWMIIGILIYLVYGLHNSRLNHPESYINLDTTSTYGSIE